MFFIQLILFLFTFHGSYSDWISEWMSPVQEQFNMDPFRKSNSESDLKFFNGEFRIGQVNHESLETEAPIEDIKPSTVQPTSTLKMKLENTLENAKMLADTLKTHIVTLITRESVLKEAIINGRLGVSMVTVSTTNQLPRSYIIRDGRWILCNGMIQLPVSSATDPMNLFHTLFSEPRCIGKEVTTKQDTCVFNSIIKYETVPSRRALEYSEDDYLCLKTSFNKTLERYMSVTTRLMNETCTDGTIRSMVENNAECGMRILSEYSYYPYKSSRAATSLPLEYCVEKDGSCKLIIAWHVSNGTIENFEFLKNEHNFKKYFIKSGPYLEHVN